MAAVIERTLIGDITERFNALSALVPLHAIRSQADYERAVSVMNLLLDAGAADEHSPLAALVDTLGALIGDYDDRQLPVSAVSAVSPRAALRFLMQQHRLKQSDLPEVGSQGVVSEILRGKRELNLRQIKKLAARFDVPVAVFI